MERYKLPLHFLFYQNRSNSSNYSKRGSRPGNDSMCGSFSINLSIDGSYSYWVVGAALVYQNRNSSSPFYALHGGASGSSSWCGSFFVNMSFIFSLDGWYIGAALLLSKSK